MPGSIIAGVATGLVNNALSQENAQAQRDWQERMFHLQNKYNHPAAMADRMRSAGLNPYNITGAEPAGSVGTGATAQTIPLENPFESVLLGSQILKTNAETGLLGGQTQKVNAEWLNTMAQLPLLQQQFQMGLLSYQEYEAKVKKYLEFLENNNPFETENENIQADTDLKREQSETEEAKQANLEALTATENQLRDLKEDQIQQQIDESKALVSKLDAEEKKIIRETEHIENLVERENVVNACSAFYGVDISSLPSEVQVGLMQNWRSVVVGSLSIPDAMQYAYEIVAKYRYKAIHIQHSKGQNQGRQISIGYGKFKFGASASGGWSEAY